jgi:hypothetical protein
VSFPDIAHPVLAEVGLCPEIGAGEVANLAQALRIILGESMSMPIEKIHAVLIAHHALLVNPPELVPYYARIDVGGDQVTGKVDLNKMIAEAQRLILGVPELSASMTASHAVKLVSALLSDFEEVLLAPGAKGMAGCMPVRVSSTSLDIEIPRELSLHEIEAWFNQGMKVDGVEKINDDGSIVFSESALRVLRDILGIDRRVLQLSQLNEMSDELLGAYRRMSAAVAH